MEETLKDLKRKININYSKNKKNNRNAYLLFSHELTMEQKKELGDEWKCQECIYLPEELQKIWSNAKGEEEEKEIFENYLLSERVQSNDLVLIQGEWGLTYHMIEFTKSIGAIPIYSYSTRKASEEKKEDCTIKTSIFQHITFKKY